MDRGTKRGRIFVIVFGLAFFIFSIYTFWTVAIVIGSSFEFPTHNSVRIEITHWQLETTRENTTNVLFRIDIDDNLDGIFEKSTISDVFSNRSELLSPFIVNASVPRTTPSIIFKVEVYEVDERGVKPIYYLAKDASVDHRAVNEIGANDSWAYRVSESIRGRLNYTYCSISFIYFVLPIDVDSLYLQKQGASIAGPITLTVAAQGMLISSSILIVMALAKTFNAYAKHSRRLAFLEAEIPIVSPKNPKEKLAGKFESFNTSCDETSSAMVEGLLASAIFMICTRILDFDLGALAFVLLIMWVSLLVSYASLVHLYHGRKKIMVDLMECVDESKIAG